MSAVGKTIRIVLVEDLAASASSVQEQLHGAFAGVEIDIITCEFDFRDALSTMTARPPSLFIIDMILPWTTPRVPMPAQPDDAREPYRAGARCIRALLGRPETAKIPILLHSAVEFAGIPELKGMPHHIMQARKGSDLPGIIRSVLQPTMNVPGSRRVFVVHGHDRDIREAVIDLLKRLDLVPVVIADRVAKGKTFVELLEQAKVEYAVVLLTADDVGRAKSEKKNRSRARQNVIMELGFFVARLGRHRVCSLWEDGVEVPTDYQAVKYVELDLAGTWKRQLADEINAADIPVDISRVS